jgi:hypothetical protein
MRMFMRRFTHLTNAFSKELENHVHALSRYFVHYKLEAHSHDTSGSPRDDRWPHRQAHGLGRYYCDHGYPEKKTLARKRAAVRDELPNLN